MLSAKNYTDEAVARVSLELTALTELTSFIDSRISNITNEYTKNNNLSTQTWYLYTDEAPFKPIPFNIVLSVENNNS